MPLAIRVEYLTGYSVAATPGGSAEWPPHPARLFMALVASVYETGGDADQLAALRWLEAQSAPAMFASECDERRAVEVYVPPNDATSPRNADKVSDKNLGANLLVLPQFRTNRQPRTFPRCRPHDPMVTFRWEADPGKHAGALADACASVARLGHSSSLVQVWLDQDGVDNDDARLHYEPDELGTHRLRSPNSGSLDDLDARFRREDVEDHFALDAAASANGKAGKAAQARYEERFGRPWSKNVAPPQRLRPEMTRAVGYRLAGDVTDVPGSLFDPHLLVFRLNPKKGETTFRFLSAAKGPEACDVFKKALLAKAGDALPALTGHGADGSPLEGPHAAFVPLLDVGGRYPRGHLLGLALALPKQMSRHSRTQVAAAVHQVGHLTLGKLGVWSVEPTTFDEKRVGLDADKWTKSQTGATCWATVTPISLDRHVKAKDATAQQEELAAGIRTACEQIGLPAPERVVPFPISPHRGAPNGYDYPRLPRKDGSKRRQTHAMLWFAEPIVGPMLLGAGRYRGWGVCRPYREGGAA